MCETSCLFGSRFAYACAFFFFRGIVLQKCGGDINCSLDYNSSWVKNSIILQSTPKQSSTLADFFHQSAPVKIGLSTCKPWSEHAGGWIHIFCMKRLRTFCTKYIQEWKIKNKIKTYSTGWFSYPMVPLSCRSNLTGLYIYVKCKLNFKEHTYQRNSLYFWSKNKFFIS